MRILVLNGSSRSNGNTKQMVEAFQDSLNAYWTDSILPLMSIGIIQSRSYTHGILEKRKE